MFCWEALNSCRIVRQDAARSAGWFEEVDRFAVLDPLAFGYALRTRRVPPEGRRSALDYGLHRMTQWRVGRAARRTVAATRRVARRSSRRVTRTGS